MLNKLLSLSPSVSFLNSKIIIVHSSLTCEEVKHVKLFCPCLAHSKVSISVCCCYITDEGKKARRLGVSVLERCFLKVLPNSQAL